MSPETMKGRARSVLHELDPRNRAEMGAPGARRREDDAIAENDD